MSKLTKVRVEKNTKYVTINLTAVEDERLSWTAKGVHLYFMSRPPDWKVRIADLLNRSSQGRHALKAAIRELKENGYLCLRKIRGDDGQFIDNEYVIYEISQLEKPTVGETDVRETRLTGNPSDGKPTPLIINSSNNQQELEINNMPAPQNGAVINDQFLTPVHEFAQGVNNGNGAMLNGGRTHDDAVIDMNGHEHGKLIVGSQGVIYDYGDKKNGGAGEQTNGKSNKVKNKAMVSDEELMKLFNFWNSLGIIFHKVRPNNGRTTFRMAVEARLQQGYTLHEICLAMRNYADTIKMPDSWWKYKWTVTEFLIRGLDRFVHLATKDNFKVNDLKSRDANYAPLYHQQI